jgi:hypothetical protein
MTIIVHVYGQQNFLNFKFPATGFPQHCYAMNFGHVYKALLRKQVTGPAIDFKIFYPSTLSSSIIESCLCGTVMS